MQRRGVPSTSDKNFFPGRGDFSPWMGFDSTPPPPPPPPQKKKQKQNKKPLSDKTRPSLCTHAFHCTDSNDPDIHILDSDCRQEKTHTAPSTKTECDYLNGWIKKQNKRKNKQTNKKTVTYAKILPKMVSPRDIAGERRSRRRLKSPTGAGGVGWWWWWWCGGC